MATRPRIVVITGVGRTGTSTAARILMGGGLRTASKLLTNEATNPGGLFEDAFVVEANKQLLAMQGDDLAVDEHRQEIRERLRQHLRENLGEEPLGIKDPRITQLMPFWQDLLSEVGAEVRVVLCTRGLIPTMASLARHYGSQPERYEATWRERMARFLSDCSLPFHALPLRAWRDSPSHTARDLADGLGLDVQGLLRTLREVEAERAMRERPTDAAPVLLTTLSPSLIRFASDLYDLSGLVPVETARAMAARLKAIPR